MVPVRSAVKVSDPAPLRRTEISITVHLGRDATPVVGAPVYLINHYKTVEERFPPNDGTVQTNVNGDATLTFNIGDATVGLQGLGACVLSGHFNVAIEGWFECRDAF